MTDLGLAFDDDDLDTHKKKHSGDRDLPYHVKIVVPRWFDEALKTLDCSGQEPQVLKFSGDYRYRLKDYAGAAEQYKAALAILPENNVAVSQDLRESLSRCHALTGNFDDGLKLARDLVKEMALEDEAHQRQSLILLSFVCEKAGLWEECVETLQQLCLLQPNFPQTWFQLGDAVMNLARRHEQQRCSEQSSDAGSCHTKNSVQSSSQDEMVEKHLLVVLTCYTRAKQLLESVLGCASDLIKKRNQMLIAEVSDKVKGLSLPDEIKQRAYEAVPKNVDVPTGDLKDTESERIDHQIEGHVHQDIASLFYQRFCSWYLNST